MEGATATTTGSSSIAAGDDDDDDDEIEVTMPQAKRRERRARADDHRGRAAAFVPLRDLGLPVSLCILVSSLMDAKNVDVADRYRTADEVEEDLMMMIVDPERYLLDAGADEMRGRLIFPEDRLYGREGEMATLMGVVDRVVGSSSSGDEREMALVAGSSGTGKSALVEQMREPLLERNGHFISAKFDELGQVQPMSVIFAAFDEYCSNLVEGDASDLARISMSIKNALGSNGNVLTDLMPNLSTVIGESASSTVRIDGKEALNRLLLYFRAFVGAIASPLHPAILFLDDLQWADKASLELVSMLISDADITSLLFVGCYRDNEVGGDHPLRIETRNIALAGVNITNIKLENINCESVNALVSDALHLSPRLTRSLADIAYSKTSGSPLFAVQFLRALFEEHLLQFSASSRRWEWDVEAIQSKDIADNVVGLMTKKMRRLDPSLQWMLKVAACIGSQCQASTLKYLEKSVGAGNELDTMMRLEVLVDEGLMSRMGSGSSFYKFSHDQIQHAAYSLIAARERGAVHLHIGRALWKKPAEKELNDIIFIVVDQLQRGSDLISDHSEKVGAARLCLMAGKKAMASSVFLQASVYLVQGSALLEDRDWNENYPLCLDLYTCCAEAQYASGNLDGAAVMLNPVLKHGRIFQDKLRAYYTLLYTLGAQGKHLDTVKYGLIILSQLGESFPMDPNQVDVINDFGKTKAMLQETSAEEILEKDQLQDSTKVVIMKLFAILMRFAYEVNQELFSLLIFRAVQMSLRFGVCQESALAFGMLGLVFISFGDFENGHLYGTLALSLLEKFENKEYLPHVYGVVYCTAVIFKMPSQAGLPSLKRGCEVGLSMGNVEWAMTNANVYCVLGIQCGIKLEPLSKQVRTYVKQMKGYHHHMLSLTLPCLEAILNLMGDALDPSNLLTGEATNQDENLMEEKHQHVLGSVFFVRMWLAYLFGKYDAAAEAATLSRNTLQSQRARNDTMVNETFYSGLIAVVMSKREDQRKWRGIAFESLEKLKAWAELSSWNFQHKLNLLNAEIVYYLNGDVDGAAKAYDEAIRFAGEHSFVHEQALACERAGIFHSEVSSAEIPAAYFERAQKHYLEWGATRKARDLAWRFGTEQGKRLGEG